MATITLWAPAHLGPKVIANAPSGNVYVLGTESQEVVADVTDQQFLWDLGLVPGAGHSDAPFDGKPYLRQDGDWVVLDQATGGTAGPTGPQGPQGDPGPPGAVGPAGPQGPPGPNGAAGTNGADGATGPIGPQGTVGPQGPAGPSGADSIVPGPTGPAGPQGSAGAQGPPGANSTVPGPTGPTGAAGAIGAQGPAGMAGPTGLQGPQGAAGPAGPTGPQGLQGAVGTAGAPGAVGATGPTGAAGAVGAAGPQGIAGPTGPTGPMPPASIINPAMDGPAAPGVGTNYSREDHVHPTDTSRVPLAGGTMTGLLNLKGTIAADNAAAGVVGEVISSGQATAQSLTSGTPLNLVTLSLTAGDWDVWGQIIFTPSAALTSTSSAIGTTSVTLPTVAQLCAGNGAMSQMRGSYTSAQSQTIQTGMTRINVSATTPVYLLAQATFATGTCTAQGFIIARRAR